MDNQHLTKYTPDMQGQYYVLDTTVDSTQTATIAAMNGRQGDKMRAVPIAFVDDGQPRDLTSTKIELRAQDSSGIVKISDKILNPVSMTGGLIVFGVPEPFYESPGEVQHAYFVLTDKTATGDDQVVSTVNVDFTVLENGIDVSQASSKIYVSSIDDMLKEAKTKAEAVQLMNSNNQAMVAGYTALLSENAVALKDADQKFTGANVFTNLTAQSLSAPAITSLVATASSTTSAVSSLDDRGDQTTSSLSSLDVVGSTTSASIATVSSSVAVLSSSLASLSSAQSSTASSMADSSMTSLASAVKTISTTASSTVSRVDGLDSELNSVSSQYDDLSNAVQSDEFNITTISDAASTALYDASLASSAVAPLSSQIGDVNSTVEAIQSSVIDNTTQIERANAAEGVHVEGVKALAVANAALDLIGQMLAGSNSADIKASASSVYQSLNALDTTTVSNEISQGTSAYSRITHHFGE